ncbi:hypothetical protein [Streptomyces indiaensis]|uniref:hypothetical protein n=1 Tax=Streptomyces indiaensis TaxID=284033 RepID=UPI001F4813E4|nr:hypothetical protein [Streptomyces indiaensis]MCF1648491.1 hypothetical protein [Streptomyces indiaensis]
MTALLMLPPAATDRLPVALVTDLASVCVGGYETSAYTDAPSPNSEMIAPAMPAN